MRIVNPLVAAAIAAALASACAAPMAAAPVAAASAVPATAATVAGQPGQASAALQGRAEDLLKLINGEADPAKMFHPKFLAQVPAERLTKIAGAVRGRYGRALAIDRIEATGPNRGTVFITLEKSQVSMKLGVEAAAPHFITELLL